MKTLNEKLERDSRKAGIAKMSAFVVFCLLLCATVSLASFEGTGVGARQIALGNAFSALADDVNTVYFNPAGLEKLRWMELSTFAGKMYEGLSDDSSLANNFLGFAYPMGSIGTVGLGWHSFSLDGYYSENTYGFNGMGQIIDDYIQRLFIYGSFHCNVAIRFNTCETLIYFISNSPYCLDLCNSSDT